MKKFVSLENIVLFVYTLLCYVVLLFVDEITSDKHAALTLTIISCTNAFFGLFLLQSNYSILVSDRQHKDNAEITKGICDVIHESVQLQLRMTDKINDIRVDMYRISTAVDRIENQTKAKVKAVAKKKKLSDIPKIEELELVK